MKNRACDVREKRRKGGHSWTALGWAQTRIDVSQLVSLPRELTSLGHLLTVKQLCHPLQQKANKTDSQQRAL